MGYVEPHDLVLFHQAAEPRRRLGGRDGRHRAGGRARPVPLHLGVPLADGTEPLTVEVTKPPAHGVLELGGRPLEASASIPADDLAEVSYKPQPGQPAADQFGYAVKTADGRAVPSTVRIRSASRPRPPADRPRPLRRRGRARRPERPRRGSSPWRPMSAPASSRSAGISAQRRRRPTDGCASADTIRARRCRSTRRLLAPGDLVRVADLQEAERSGRRWRMPGARSMSRSFPPRRARRR